MVRYVQLAHNRRVGGVTSAEVLLNLGCEDALDVDGLRRLARSITRYTDGESADAREGLGQALWFLGEVAEGIASRERAFEEHLRGERCSDAARVG